MPTYTVAKAGVCAGGSHLHITVTDGANVRNLRVDVDYLRSPVTEDEIEATFKILTRSALRQLTPAQALAKLNAGFNVVID